MFKTRIDRARILDFTHHFKSRRENRSLSYFTLYYNLATPLLNNGFANTQTEASTKRITLLMSFQITKINKQTIQFVRRYTNTEVLDTKLKFDVTCLQNLFL